MERNVHRTAIPQMILALPPRPPRLRVSLLLRWRLPAGERGFDRRWDWSPHCKSSSRGNAEDAERSRALHVVRCSSRDGTQRTPNCDTSEDSCFSSASSAPPRELAFTLPACGRTRIRPTLGLVAALQEQLTRRRGEKTGTVLAFYPRSAPRACITLSAAIESTSSISSTRSIRSR
jgi:hypothetical protein